MDMCPGFGDLSGDVRTFLFTTAGDHDFRARFYKGQRRSSADAGRSSGN
jgi:hypothetical protein